MLTERSDMWLKFPFHYSLKPNQLPNLLPKLLFGWQ